MKYGFNYGETPVLDWRKKFKIESDSIVVSVPQNKSGEEIELKRFEHQLVTVKMADGSQGVASTRHNPWLAYQAQKTFQAAIDKAGEPSDTDGDIDTLDLEDDRDPVCACDVRECGCSWREPCEGCVFFYEKRSRDFKPGDCYDSCANERFR